MQTLMETSRLLLKQLTPDYAQVIFDTYAQDAQVCKYTSWTKHASIETTQAFVAQVQQNRSANTSYTYAIVRREDGVFLGSIDIRLHKKSTSFGYVIGRKFR